MDMGKFVHISALLTFKSPKYLYGHTYTFMKRICIDVIFASQYFDFIAYSQWSFAMIVFQESWVNSRLIRLYCCGKKPTYTTDYMALELQQSVFANC